MTDLTCTGDAVGAFRSAGRKRDVVECRLGYEVCPFVWETTVIYVTFRRLRLET